MSVADEKRTLPIGPSTVGAHCSYEIIIDGDANYRAVVTIAYDVTNPSHFRTGGSEVHPALASIDELYLLCEGGNEYPLINQHVRIEPVGIWDLVDGYLHADWDSARQACVRHFSEQ